YLYFKDKEDIFLAVVLRCLTFFKDSFVKASRMVPDNNIWLKEYAWAFFCFSKEYPEYMDLIMVYETRHFIYTEVKKPNRHSERKAACQKISDNIADMVTHTIEKALEQGTIVSDLKSRQLMLLLWGQIFGVIQILRIRKKNFEDAFELDRDTLFNHFVGMMQAALTKQ
ncbi:TetR/AcrR family transcriptional regulator, partial [bacterium]|nr:TetR/AcrR family transcriptional regulator [bacterium]